MLAQDMEMEIEDQEETLQLYDIVQLDFDYEYDAARFFDFSKPESEAEARLSELWFSSAPNYPPSPFVAKMFPMEGIHAQNVSPKSKYDSMPLVYDDADINHNSHYCQDMSDREETSQPLGNIEVGTFANSQNQGQGLFGGQSTGLSFYNHLTNDFKKTKAKSLAKAHMPRSSTLMKPTASQLAKKNQRRQAVESRLQKSEDTNSLCGVENQASKRQKLDGGDLRRIVDVKQPRNLIHKTPKKDVVVQGIGVQSKLRITIPREPDLETAHRAERMRSTINKGVDKPTATTSRFKARPLNRKILEAPAHSIPKRTTPHSQEFQAFCPKTSEKAKLLPSSAKESSFCQTEKGPNRGSVVRNLGTGNKDGNRCDPVDAPKLAERQSAHGFKARPLDRKILTSRGDLGVFRNNKRDVTVPKEFEFQTAKRNQQNLPIDLFSKLSLAGEPQPKNSVQPQFLNKSSNPSKGSKENRWQSCRQDQNMNLQTRGTQDIHGQKHIPNTTNGAISEIGLHNGINRTGAIWRQ